MQVVRYAAGDWGVGELWLDAEGLPVWHELPRRTLELTRAGPQQGGAAPPTITLPVPVHVRNGTVPNFRRIAAYLEASRLPSPTSRST
jgi:hypothetical protein